MSAGKYVMGIFIYSGSFIGEARKKLLRSAVINFALRHASEITLFMIDFVSTKDAAGEDASSAYGSLSPPTTRRALYCSSFSGR